MNNMITDEQLAEITSGVVDGMPPTTQEVAMALELQERRAADRNFFMYGIAEPDGRAYMEEVCVSNDIGILQLIVDELNLNEGTDGYRVVALHTALPLTHPEREELEEYHKASQAARDIWAERQRQQAVKGFSTQQDDTYIGGNWRRLPSVISNQWRPPITGPQTGMITASGRQTIVAIW